MAKEQKGFIVYGDIQDTIKELNDEQVAQLFRGMVDYFVDGKAPKFSGVLKFVFIPIKQQMDRDTEKYVSKCEKNRKNIKDYWDRTKDTNEYERIRTNTIATNTNTKTNTKTNTDTTTTTNTKVGGGGDCDDDFDIWKHITPKDIDKIYDAYPESGGFLLEEVAADVKAKRKKIKNVASYILGYAKKVGWDDNADHFKEPWEAS